MPGPVSRITAYHYHQAGWRRSAGVCPDRSPSRRKIVTSSRNRRYCSAFGSEDLRIFSA